MIYTSYFAKYKGDKGISIARFKPKWFNGKSYPLLAPSENLLMWWKQLDKDAQNDINYQKQYCDIYIKETLNPLEKDVDNIAKELDGCVLLCYEKTKDFCHRHIVANWLSSHGYLCKELD